MSWEGRNETGCTAQDQTEQNRIVVAVVQSLSRVQLLITPWTTVHQASLSFTAPWSLLKFMSIESAMPSNHLILCHPLLPLPSIFPNIRGRPCIRWPKYWSFSFSISPSNEFIGSSRLISCRTDWLDLLEVQGTRKSSPGLQFESINSLALSLLYGPILISIHDY